VAHNADFDIGFLTAAAARCGVDFHPVYLDTLVLYAKHREGQLQKKQDIKASKEFRKELTGFIGLIMKVRGASAPLWIRDLTGATFHAGA
jgi:hypothetical protein